jgi:hypothetical protein
MASWRSTLLRLFKTLLHRQFDCRYFFAAKMPRDILKITMHFTGTGYTTSMLANLKKTV